MARAGLRSGVRAAGPCDRGHPGRRACPGVDATSVTRDSPEFGLALTGAIDSAVAIEAIFTADGDVIQMGRTQRNGARKRGDLRHPRGAPVDPPRRQGDPSALLHRHAGHARGAAGLSPHPTGTQLGVGATSVALTVAQTGSPSARPSSATAAGVTSATSGTSPVEAHPDPVAEQVEAGDRDPRHRCGRCPPGGCRCRATAWGWMSGEHRRHRWDRRRRPCRPAGRGRRSCPGPVPRSRFTPTRSAT